MAITFAVFQQLGLVRSLSLLTGDAGPQVVITMFDGRVGRVAVQTLASADARGGGVTIQLDCSALGRPSGAGDLIGIDAQCVHAASALKAAYVHLAARIGLRAGCSKCLVKVVAAPTAVSVARRMLGALSCGCLVPAGSAATLRRHEAECARLYQREADVVESLRGARSRTDRVLRIARALQAADAPQACLDAFRADDIIEID